MNDFCGCRGAARAHLVLLLKSDSLHAGIVVVALQEAPHRNFFTVVKVIGYSVKLLSFFSFFNFLFFLFSRDGQSRAGVYCAANACIEQVIQHGEVDVFQAVKTVRRHRPQLVENIVSTSTKMQMLLLR